MDNDAMKQAFADLSPEDMELLLKGLGMEEEKKEDPPPPPPPPSASEIASAVASRMPAPPPAPEAPPPPREAFDMKRFQEQFLADPSTGLTYAYQTKYGYDPIQVIPVMAAALAETRNQMEQLRAQSFKAQAQLPDEDYQKVEQFRQAKNLDWQDAYDLAKVRGIVGAPPQQSTPSAPPRLPRGGGKPDTTFDESTVHEQAAKMTDEQLENMMLKFGVINQRHW
jgi:hypothetical protein